MRAVIEVNKLTFFVICYKKFAQYGQGEIDRERRVLSSSLVQFKVTIKRIIHQ